LDAVKAAQGLESLPDSVAAALSKKDDAGPKTYFDCRSVDNPADANPFGNCASGDRNGSKNMVIYGDSRASMWAAALEGVAAANGWKLWAFGLGGCPVPDLQFTSYQTKTENENCNVFHASAVAAIKALKPDLVVVTSISNQQLVDGSWPNASQWQEGWVSTFNKLAQPGTRFAMIGNIPVWKNNDARCLAAHVRAIQDCSAAPSEATPDNLEAEQAAAAAVGAEYVSTVPWICGDRCEPVIADKIVFTNQFHFTQSYAVYLTGALNEALKPLLTQP
jgi:hypothetical protein